MSRKFKNYNISFPFILEKTLPESSLILTPQKFKVLNTLNNNDELFAFNGEITKIFNINKLNNIKTYQISFTDSLKTNCCENHLLLTSSSPERRWRKVNISHKLIKDIDNSLKYGKDNRDNHSIPFVGKIDFKDNLPLDPYLLGALIGDGTFSHPRVNLSNVDEKVLNYFKTELDKVNCKLTNCGKCDYHIVKKLNIPNKKATPYVVKVIRDLSLSGTKAESKFIPECYKFSSYENRIKLLKGLMDTDGCKSKNCNAPSFSSASIQLANDVKFLINSLGGRATLTSQNSFYTYKGKRLQGQDAHKLYIILPTEIIPFTIDYKINEYLNYVNKTKFLPRYIKNVEYIGEFPAIKFSIANPSQLVMTNDFIPI